MAVGETLEAPCAVEESFVGCAEGSSLGSRPDEAF